MEPDHEKLQKLVAWLEDESEDCRKDILKETNALHREHLRAGQYCYNHIAAYIRNILLEDKNEGSNRRNPDPHK